MEGHETTIPPTTGGVVVRGGEAGTGFMGFRGGGVIGRGGSVWLCGWERMGFVILRHDQVFCFERARMSKPVNVLFILADQWRADCLGAVGNPVIQTPNLDALAAEGTLFRQCFVQTAPCGPSRMCMYTSRYLCSHRTVNNKVPLVDAQENIAMALRGAGYRPGLIGYNDYAVDPRILPSDG